MTKTMTGRVWGIIALPCILFGAMVVRLWNIGVRDFWYDEAFTGNAIRLPWREMYALLQEDLHPPLHYVLLKLFSLIAGQSVVSLRLFSAICGIVLVYVVYRIGSVLVDRRVGLIAAALVAMNPFLIQFSQEARMYSLLTVCVASGFYFFLRATSTRSWVSIVASGMFLGFAMLSHVMGFVFAGCIGIAFIFLRYGGFKKQWRADLRLLAIPVIALAVFAPWLPTFVYQLHEIDAKGNHNIVVQSRDALVDVAIFFVGTPKGERSAGLVLTNPVVGVPAWVVESTIVIVLVGATAWAVRRRPREALVAACVAGVPIGVIAVFGALGFGFTNARYVLPAVPFVCVILAIGLQKTRIRFVIPLFSVYALFLLFFVRPPANSVGYNQLQSELSKYPDAHFYALNTFDYMITKWYVGVDRVTLYNWSWPQFDPRGWPGIGVDTLRTERLEDIFRDQHAIVLQDVLFPREQRDDKDFDSSQFTLLDVDANILLYRPKR